MKLVHLEDVHQGFSYLGVNKLIPNKAENSYPRKA